MTQFKTRKKYNITITKLIVVVFLLIISLSLSLFNLYGQKYSSHYLAVSKTKLKKVTYQFFSDLITEKDINDESTTDIIFLNVNSKGEIISVDYNMEKTYQLLTKLSNVLKSSLSDLEHGRVDVQIYDEMLTSSDKGLILNVPFFAGSKNIFLNSLGPTIPIKVKFSGSLLTNIKTKVTNYGINNALLEVYVTVKITEYLISPLPNNTLTLDYDILVSAKVVNGKVPNYFGKSLESNSNLVNSSIEN